MHYNVKFGNFNFLADVDEIDDNTTEVRVGGSDKFCVVIHVYNDEDYIYISELIYDSSCCLSQNLPKSEGTIALLNASLSLCKNLFSTKRFATLTDESVIKCGHGKILPLPEVYVLLHGTTWYSSKFGATPYEWSRSKRNAFDTLIHTLSQPPSLSWDVVWGKYLSNDFSQDAYNEVKLAFQQSSNWHEFFNKIRRDNCTTWYTWIRSLFRILSKDMVLTGTTWKINLPKYDVEYSVVEKPKKTIKPSYQGLRLFGGHYKR